MTSARSMAGKAKVNRFRTQALASLIAVLTTIGLSGVGPGSVASARVVEAHRLGRPIPRSAVDWWKFQFDLGNTGYNPFEDTIGPGNVGDLIQGWSVDLGNLVGLGQSPVVADGSLFVSTAGG